MKKLLLLIAGILISVVSVVRIKQRERGKMTEWVVGIIGNKSDLEKLSMSFNSPKLCITRDTPQGGTAFILESTDFSSLKEHEEVKKKAEEIIPRIIASARLSIGLKKQIKAGQVNRIHSNGKRESFIVTSGGIGMGGSAPVEVVEPNGTVRKILPIEPDSRWLEIAERNKNVAKVMDFLSAETLDWHKLYCVYEKIKEDVGGIDKIKENKWATKGKIKLFTQTANSHGAIGTEARHSTDKYKPPKNPMVFSDAIKLIMSITRKWFNSKLVDFIL
ncbi:MAG: hypothetical protein JRJ00_01250 [Deltaproteobacteria bacterium]|nr:hypothetical protein [Deltaproteobacteria bacterium]